MQLVKSALLLGVVAFFSALPARAQVPVDLDLDRRAVADSTLPWGWNFWPLLQTGYRIAVVGGPEGVQPPTLTIAHEGEGAATTAVYRIPSPLGAGRSVAFVADVNLESPTAVLAIGMVARQVIDGQFVIVAADTLVSAQDVGSQTVRAEIDVPPDAHMVDLWITPTGNGSSVVTNLRLEVDGRVVRADAASEQPPMEVMYWIRSNALDWGAGALDGPPSFPGLDELLGDRRIILLGETTHGTHEFFRVRHRIIETLLSASVDQRATGDTSPTVVVALEDHLTAVLPLNEYVSGASDDREAATAGLFEIYDRDAFHDFIDGLRDLHAAGARVEIWGVDMQDPRAAIDRLAERIERLDAPVGQQIIEDYAPIRERWFATGEGAPTADTLAQWAERARDLEREVATLDGPNDESDALTRRLARLVMQAVDLRIAGHEGPRDAFMAENLLWILEQRNPDRMVFWGHTGHTRLSEGGTGAYLRDVLHEDLISIALLTYEGEYTASWPRDGRWQPGSFSLFPGPARSLEHALHEAGLSIGALDLGRVPDDDGHWLRSDLQVRSIGALPVDYGFVPTTPTSTFDAVVFIDRTSAARPTP